MEWEWLLGQSAWYGLVNGAAYVAFAIGVSLIYGVMGALNLAHGELSMLGAMFTYTLMTNLGMPYFAAFILAIVLVAICGLVLHRVSIRPLIHKSPLSVILATLAVGYIILHVSGEVWGSVPYALDSPFTGVMEVPGGIRISMERGMLLLFAVLGVVVLYLLLNRTGAGKRMRATAQNVTGARLVGINTDRVFDLAMIISAALAGLSGIIIATVWSASTFIGQRIFIKGFVIVIIGGMGNIWGVIAIGLAIGIAEAIFGAFVSPYYREAFIYGIMVVALLLKPEGIFTKRI